MNRILTGLILVIVGFIIVLITMSTHYITSQICFFGVIALGGIISFGVMLILTMKFQKWGWLKKY